MYIIIRYITESEIKKTLAKWNLPVKPNFEKITKNLSNGSTSAILSVKDTEAPLVLWHLVSEVNIYRNKIFTSKTII